ncbi:MAG: hypothetical protein RIQ93_2104, partial [Verrucomicrobiota bacterium]
MHSLLHLCRPRALLRLKLPAVMLLTLLQRSPAVRVVGTLEQAVTGSPLGAVLRSTLASAASLGALHSMAGATVLEASQPGPFSASVGATVAIGFTVTNTINIASWRVTGSFPPGLALTAIQGGNPLTSAGVLQAPGGGDDGYGNVRAPTTTPLLIGTPTQPGTYTLSFQAWELANTSGLASRVFDYTINVAGSAQPAPAPAFTTQPSNQTATAGASATFTAAASGSPMFEWRRDGAAVAGGTTASLTVANVQPTNAGIYYALVSNAAGSGRSQPAMLGVNSAVKLIGTGQEFPDIRASNGNIYDQILLGAAAASVKADLGQILRISFLDLNDDIVQVEFSGAGTLTIVLDGATGPAAPLKYNQPTTPYMKGHAGIILTGANATTNLTVFSVGRAINTNENLYLPGAAFDGFADIAYIAISSTDGQFAGLRAANANCFALKGYTGIYAPGVQFSGPVFISDINASDDATPALIIGGGNDVRITGGDLFQANG